MPTQNEIDNDLNGLLEKYIYRRLNPPYATQTAENLAWTLTCAAAAIWRALEDGPPHLHFREENFVSMCRLAFRDASAPATVPPALRS